MSHYSKIIFLTTLIGCFARSHNEKLSSQPSNKSPHYNFTAEKSLEISIKTHIAKFWTQGDFVTFNGVKNIRINAASFQHNKTIKSENCLLIVPGRGESYLKYQELIFDIYNQGYDIFILDHRGQGLSERSLKNKNKGYVEKFQYYVDDLDYFMKTFVIPTCQNKPFMLAHSMGGAIGATYLQQNPTTIKAAVLASPMFAIPSHGIPFFIAKALLNTGQFFEHLFSDTSWYFFGQQDFKKEKFEDNNLMHSQARYKLFTELYVNNPALQLGGVTFQWVHESLSAIDEIFLNLNKLSMPIIVFKAELDSTVDTEGQDDFCKQLYRLNPLSCPNSRPEYFKGAYHELFFETDEIRHQAISTTLNWFNQNR
jgi:lysophospholipase